MSRVTIFKYGRESYYFSLHDHNVIEQFRNSEEYDFAKKYSNTDIIEMTLEHVALLMTYHVFYADFDDKILMLWKLKYE